MDPLEEYTSLYNVRLMHFQGRKRGKNPQEVKYQFAVCAIVVLLDDDKTNKANGAS